MKICFTSTASPWFFGPYGNQLSLLCDYFINKGYDIYYLYLINSEKRLYTYNEMISIDTRRKDDINDRLLSKIKFIGGIKESNGCYLTSNINDLCQTNNITHILFLMDLAKIIFDEEFINESYIWYPNHSYPINTMNKNKLQYFNNILSLSPSDCKMIKNYIKEINKNIHVEYVPHIINIKKPKKSKKELRRIHNFNSDDYIIFMNIGNYDIQNRKSIDSAIFGFEDYILKGNNAILFIHTYDIRQIDINNHYTPLSQFLELDDLLNFINENVRSKIHIINKVVSKETIIEYLYLSDVMLQTSKCEGFGLPVLEAQKLGLPVITTKIGSMDDHTYNGISVEPIQKMYENIGKSIWYIPSIKGISDALVKIQNKDYKDNHDFAISKISDKMSTNNVCNIIENLFSKIPIRNNKINNSQLIQIIYYDKKGYIIDGLRVKNIEPIMIYGKWLLLIENKFIFNKKQLKNICISKSEYDIIVLQTKYINRIYPTNNDLKMNNMIPDMMNYLVKSSKVKSLIENNLLPNYMKGFIMLSLKNISDVVVIDKPILLEKI